MNSLRKSLLILLVQLMFIFISSSSLSLEESSKSKLIGEEETDAPSLPEDIIKLDSFNWDIGISHANSITFLSLLSSSSQYKNSNSHSIELSLPPPTNVNSSQFKINITQEGVWRKFQIDALCSDNERKLVFFTNSYEKNLNSLSTIGYYNMSSNSTTILHGVEENSINFMVLSSDSQFIYFCDKKSNSLYSLLVSNLTTSQSQQQQPQLLFSLQTKNSQITGLSLSPSSEYLFLSTFEEGQGHIYTLNIKNLSLSLLKNNLLRVHGLHYSNLNSSLFFTNTPRQGLENRIEKILINSTNLPKSQKILETNLSQNSENSENLTEVSTESVFKFGSRNQLPYSIVNLCNYLLWTDSISKSVWKSDLELTNENLDRIFTPKIYLFNIPTPYSVVQRKEYSYNECIERKIREVKTTSQSEAQKNLGSQLGRRKNSSSQSEREKISSSQSEGEKILSSQSEGGPNLNSQLGGGNILKSQSESEKMTKNFKICTKEESESFCSNGASCVFILENLYCLCAKNYGGPTCETRLNFHNSSNIFETLDSVPQLKKSIIIASSVSFFLLVFFISLSLVLSYKIWKLKGGPRIRRRVVFAKTCKNSASNGGQTIYETIEIENCCNLTVCETPCYENLATSGAGAGAAGLKSKSKSEDKEKLIEEI